MEGGKRNSEELEDRKEKAEGKETIQISECHGFDKVKHFPLKIYIYMFVVSARHR